MNQDELKWLGGYFDGKGTISLFINTTETGTTVINPYFRIYGTPTVLKYISSLDPKLKLKRYPYSPKNKGQIKHCRDDSLRIESRCREDILDLTARLMDYCVIKKERLNLVRETIILYGSKRRTTPRAEIVIEECRERARKVSRLNRRDL